MLILGGSFNGSGGGNTAIRGGIYVANIQGSSPGHRNMFWVNVYNLIFEWLVVNMSIYL